MPRKEQTITEAIILAGGFGTRLRNAVPDLPKCMAPVNGRPFIAYVIDYLRMQGIQRIIFSLGYKSEIIVQYLQEQYPTLDYDIAIETEPLGTGGAIQLALQLTRTANVVATNGDTLFKIKLAALEDFHREKLAHCSLALKPMTNFDRYGVVETDGDGRIKSFREKSFFSNGFINGGIYLINKDQFLQHSFPQKFSFEKDYLETYYSSTPIYGLPQQGYFIDIGIPEDYNQAAKDLQLPALSLNQIDASWTLILDRDGVINNERPGDYVKNWDEFVFSEGVLVAMPILAKKFNRILIVSNQRGVGKKLMTEDDLNIIHLRMKDVITEAGGRIDGIHFCTGIESKCFNRKPNPGLALEIADNYPDIDFSKTIMAGNKLSDMRFGRAAGMHTVFIASTDPEQVVPHPDIDLKFTSLLDFSRSL